MRAGAVVVAVLLSSSVRADLSVDGATGPSIECLATAQAGMVDLHFGHHPCLGGSTDYHLRLRWRDDGSGYIERPSDKPRPSNAWAVRAIARRIKHAATLPEPRYESAMFGANPFADVTWSCDGGAPRRASFGVTRTDALVDVGMTFVDGRER